ncbi:MAG: FmdB family zinc ribbon protein [Planctomycetota bacterium]
MPLYDFQCAECEATFDELVRSPSDEGSVRCPKCGSSAVKRLLSSFALGRGNSGGPSSSSSSASGCRGGSCGTCGSTSCR